jgi:hypothetical protein
VHQLIEREGAMAAAHERDRAERAPVIAPLTDLEIANVRKVAGIEPHARVFHRRIAKHAAALELGHEAIHFRGAEKQVDFRQMLEQLLLVALDHTADGDDGLTRAILLEAAGLDQCVDRLLLGGINEAARVDDDDLSGREVTDGLGAASDQSREVALAVDGILVAAQGDEADSHSEKLASRRDPLNDGRPRS